MAYIVKQERGRPHLVGGIELEQNIRLVHLIFPRMNATKLCDVIPGIPIHRCVRIPEELGARVGVCRERTVLRGPGQPPARLLLHHEPISPLRIVRMGIQFADLQ